MIIKILEIRDRATFIPVMAVKMWSDNEEEQYLLRRAGFGKEFTCIYLSTLAYPNAQWDVYNWSDGTRTMPIAHQYIENHFDELKSGDVIDVEFILGEKDSISTSERFSTVFDIL